jgi:hypothetical protein
MINLKSELYNIHLGALDMVGFLIINATTIQQENGDKLLWKT